MQKPLTMTHETALPADAKRKTPPPGRFWYRFRGLVLFPLVLFAALCHYGELENDLVLFPVGAALFLVGLSLRIWAQMHLRYRLKIHKVFTTTGPYARVRNPVYIGTTLILVALSFMSELLWLVPVMFAWCAFVYSRVVRYEEAKLLAKYGEAYACYLAGVPRWLPRWKNAPANPDPNSHARSFLLPSVVTELYILLLPVPFILKELFLT